MTTRHSYMERLDNLKNMMLKMSGLAEEAIGKAVLALSRTDIDLAGEIIREDSGINAYEEQIEELCVYLIATEQPVATDLRFIVACLNIIRDIERIGDYAVHMAKTVRTLVSSGNGFQTPGEIIRMTEISLDMLRDAMNSFAAKNESSAREIIKRDENVDNFYLTVFRDLIGKMEKDPSHARQENALLFVAKFVERMADHVVNICEEIVYFTTGKKMDWSDK